MGEYCYNINSIIEHDGLTIAKNFIGFGFKWKHFMTQWTWKQIILSYARIINSPKEALLRKSWNLLVIIFSVSWTHALDQHWGYVMTPRKGKINGHNCTVRSLQLAVLSFTVSTNLGYETAPLCLTISKILKIKSMILSSIISRFSAQRAR